MFSVRALCQTSFLVFLLSSVTTIAADSEDTDIEENLEDFYGDEDFVSIATGTKKSIKKAPAVASVITASDIRAIGARNLGEVLETIPGVHVSRSGQQLTPEFWFRGITSTFNPQALLMIDGVSQKSVVRGDNHTVWGEFPVHAIERIEVIRGPGSALYGADAFSGVINVITKRDLDQFNNEIGGMLGSFDTYNLWANWGAKISDWRLVTNFEYLESEGYDGFVEADAQTIVDSVAAGFNVPPASLAPGYFSTGFESTDLWVSLSNDLVSLGFGLQHRSNVGTGQGATEVLDPRGKLGSEKRTVKVSLNEINIADDLYFKAHASSYVSTQEIEANLLLFPPGAFLGAFPDGFIGNPQWEEETTQVELSVRYDGFESSELMFGTGYSRQNLFEVTEQKNFNPDLSPRPGGIEDVSDTPEIFIPEAYRENRYAYIQLISLLSPGWELTAGARYDDYSDFGSTFNPRLALVWSTSLKLTSKLLYGKAFRAPAFAETTVVNNPISLGNPELEPETIETLELAFNYNFSEQADFDFNFFVYEISDFITFVPDLNGITATAQNLGERSGTGFEASLAYKFENGFKLTANSAFVDAKDDLVNDDVGEYPSIQFYVQGDWPINDAWVMSSQLSVIGERERVPGDTREKLDGYTTLNIAATYRFADGKTSLKLALKNVLDDDVREPSSNTTTFGQINLPGDLPQAGSSAYLSMSTTF
ncbi:TonB-dependent receptor [Aliikangiella marina]|uniref:TonB-dependent receptor n=1 Tax=Aliikangiella marina TaxID=1712262 RepID=A0A545TIQ9_9GAMM|nr:TonB-dependent receptor [Aliikangiella marina]TQV77056.1 TonB-dependent receptor [Aliikangiella marina]